MDIRKDLDLGWGDALMDDSRGEMSRLALPCLGSSGSSDSEYIDNNIHEEDSTSMNIHMETDDDWGWRLQSTALHPVPAFYPMDPRSTRRIYLGRRREGKERGITSVEELTHRISKACRTLSVYGCWDNMSPSVTLSTMEMVEMDIAIYSDNDNCDGKFQS